MKTSRFDILVSIFSEEGIFPDLIFIALIGFWLPFIIYVLMPNRCANLPNWPFRIALITTWLLGLCINLMVIFQVFEIIYRYVF